MTTQKKKKPKKSAKAKEAAAPEAKVQEAPEDAEDTEIRPPRLCYRCSIISLLDTEIPLWSFEVLGSNPLLYFNFIQKGCVNHTNRRLLRDKRVSLSKH